MTRSTVKRTTKPVQKTMSEREIVLDILMEVLENDAFIHVILRQALSKYRYMEKQERAFITKVSEGTLEYQMQIDAVLDKYSKTPVKKMKPLIRTLLRMSVYQLLHMDRVPASAVCNEAVKLAEKRGFSGLKGFVNGVLRKIAREKETISFDDDWSLKYSMPQWILSMWEKQYGREETERMLQAFLEERPLAVRFLTENCGEKEILESLTAQNITCERSTLSDEVWFLSGVDSLEQTEAFVKGYLQVQDVSSSLVGQFAAPKGGEFVLDLCAAPGGKALHMAELLRGTGQVEARDVSCEKTAMIEENIDRIGYQNIHTKVWDATTKDAEMMEKADIVLADLPCSGLGIIGRKPDIKYRITAERLHELAVLQREILTASWQYVKPGGLLVYSTCTINKEENEENRAWFLEQFPFEPVEIFGKAREVLQEESLREGYIQLRPGIHPSDGFFIAVMRRKDGTERS